MRVGIRVDASRAMSLGHLTRCLTLADALRERGAEIVFLSAPSTAAWRASVEGRGYEIRILAPGSASPLHHASHGPPPPLSGGGEAPSSPAERGRGTARSAVEGATAHGDWLPWDWRTDAAATIAAIDAPLDWLIVDHYALEENWERALRAAAARIMAIDDLADRPHDCDLLLDQNAQDEAKDRYAGLVPPAARRLIGPSYALLRPQFAAARGRPRDGSVKRILVFMSTTDAKGATLVALEALSAPRLAAIPVDVVVGSPSPHLEAIKARAAARGRATVHIDAEDMPALCNAADLAVGTGGVAALERCCLGLPTVAVSIAANQAPGLTNLGVRGAVVLAGRLGRLDPAAIASAVEALLDDPRRIRDLSEVAAALVDGQGAARVAEHVLAPGDSLTLRAATMDDAELLLAWRNEPSIRAFFFDANPVGMASHREWLEHKLGSPDHHHWIGMLDGAPIGSIRFDVEEDQAVISIIIAPPFQRRGFAAQLLARGEAALKSRRADVKMLVAEVLRGNLASRRLFLKAGFAAVAETDAIFRFEKICA